VDGKGIPIAGVAEPANRHDSPLLVPTLEHAWESVGGLPEGANVHLDRGYDSLITRERLKDRGLNAEIAQKGKPAPLQVGKRWVVERTNAWHKAHKKLVWCTERQGRVRSTSSGWPSRT
jgi:IS5 family transposase